ncbi:hypothetical protein GBA65_03430 [Rubrobacter marinus]|uniref:Periplasmic copper-binding protein NosD beta helix domain-containing protein n=1 Tax=Rubrobacter marinus TaxID=2653852 RepID=A0A6G8PUK8_9ACTN|nr:hypothetical protein [Rubrobacter marinus]QIN77721.1 hypothetical protein GBA65_03430 [Rubrobacter marinus]
MDARTLEAARSTGAKLAVAAGLALLVFLGLGLLLFAGPAGAETCNAECPGDGGDGGAGDGGIGGGGSTTNNQWITFTVTNTNDSGDGSLRQALEVANLYSPSCIGITIGFNIPGEGVHTIRPASDLPPIPACVTVDGYSQPGAKANTLRQGNDAVLKIELNGENAGSRASGLRMDGTDSAVRGLAINRFAYYGVFLHGGRADYCDVQGNYIGTDATGTRDLGNKTAGVFIAGDSNTIGGTEPAARNVLSGNGTGVLINGSNNNVEGNYIGTKASGDEPLGNDWVGVSTPPTVSVGEIPSEERCPRRATS